MKDNLANVDIIYNGTQEELLNDLNSIEGIVQFEMVLWEKGRGGGKMKVTKIERIEGAEEGIKCEFEHNNKKGVFEYTLIGREIGIDDCDYDEDDEDIYEEIHNWIEENISVKTLIHTKEWGFLK